MLAIFLSVILLGFVVVACLPGCLGWGPEIILFLKGFGPFLALFLSIICLFVGIADIKDRKEAKKEEAESARVQDEK